MSEVQYQCLENCKTIVDLIAMLPLFLSLIYLLISVRPESLSWTTKFHCQELNTLKFKDSVRLASTGPAWSCLAAYQGSLFGHFPALESGCHELKEDWTFWRSSRLWRCWWWEGSWVMLIKIIHWRWEFWKTSNQGLT